MADGPVVVVTVESVVGVDVVVEVGGGVPPLADTRNSAITSG